MAIPLTVIIGQRGPNGVPSMTGRCDSLRNRLRFYDHSIAERYGYEGMRCGWAAAPDEAQSWARYDQLLRPCEVYNPAGQRVWEGFLYEIKVMLGRITVVYSLKDLANRLMVRYATAAGDAGATATFSNAESIALFGTRDRVVHLSGVLATSAAAQAQTRLNDLAFPQSAYPSGGGSSKGTLSYAVELTFKGWGETLEWLVTSNTSTATVAIGTQLANLIASYNATNNWIATDLSGVESGLPSDAEAIEADTTYREKFDKLLAQGNSSNRRLHWGFYDDRQLVVRTAASASPSTIGYYENVRAAEVRDRYGNVVDAWDLRPDVMVQIDEAIDTDLPGGAIDGPFRKYVTRVTCKVGEDGRASYSLEPGNAETLDSLLKAPTGTGPAGNSARQAAIERLAVHATRSRFAATDNPGRYSGGVWQPRAGGTGVPNTGIIDTGGGDITNTGGGNVDLGTGVGIGGTGSSGVTTVGGTAGALAKWTGPRQLGNAVAGTDYVAPGNLSESIDDRVAALLVAGSGIGLSYNDAGGALTITNTAGGTVGGSGTAGRLVQWATGGADLQDSTLIKTGAGLLTLSAAGAATLTIDASIRLTGSGASSGDALIYNGTAFAPTTLTPAAIGAAPSDAKYIVQQASAGLSAEQALGSLASGLLKNTTTTGVLSIAVAGTDYAAAAHTHTTTDVTNFAEAVDDRVAALLVAGSGIGLSYNDAGNVLTIANTGGTVGGTGTAGRVPQWATGGADLENSTLIKTGAGLLTLNATTTEQVQIASGGTLDLNNNVMVFPVPGSVPTGVGVNKNLVFWNSTNGVSPAANLYWDSNNGRLGINSATPAYRLELGFDSAAKPSTNTWTVVSDVRTKYPGSIVPFRDGLAALLQLRPVRFTYNGAAGTPKGGRGVGLIAQEVARVIPRWIRRSRGKLRPHDLRETELLSVNSGDFDLMVINALREIADRLTALEQ